MQDCPDPCDKSALLPRSQQITTCWDNTHPFHRPIPLQVAVRLHASIKHWVSYMPLRGGHPHCRTWEASLTDHKFVDWCGDLEHIRELREFQYSTYPAALQMAPKVTTMPRKSCTQFEAGQLGLYPEGRDGCSQPAQSQRT